MNRSYSKIRHIEESNMLLENRRLLLKEQSVSGSTQTTGTTTGGTVTTGGTINTGTTTGGTATVSKPKTDFGAKINKTHDKNYIYIHIPASGKYYFMGQPNTPANKKYPKPVEATGAGLESIKKNVKFT